MTHSNPHSLLLITPEQEWSLLLQTYLAQNGFTSVTAATSESALLLFQQIRPYLVLIDQHQADYNMNDLCSALFLAQPTLKVLLITETGNEAALPALSPPISGCVGRNLPLMVWPGLLTYILQGGMTFNRSMMELALAATRRVPARQPPLVIGGLRIDLQEQVVLYADQRVELTVREFALLACLAKNLNRVVSVDQLLNDAWGFDADHGTPSQVRLYITRLRRKLLATGQIDDFIRTERGMGYCLDSRSLAPKPEEECIKQI